MYLFFLDFRRVSMREKCLKLCGRYLLREPTSVDYDPTLETSITFFKTVQNKMHWAITGQTAAEII